MRRLFSFLVCTLFLNTACALSGGTIAKPQNPTPPAAVRPIAVNFIQPITNIRIWFDGAGITWPQDVTTTGPRVGFPNFPATGADPSNVHIRADGYQPYDCVTHIPDGSYDFFVGWRPTTNGYGQGWFVGANGSTCLPDLVPVVPPFPQPQSRAAILASHESFQGAFLTTTQFGVLPWWPTAWVSLNAADRAASYAQIVSWGDTDITVSASWSYGESGQPYGDGQLVPNTNYFAGADYAHADVAGFRAAVKDVIQHGFVPRIFMEGDNGFTYYMWVMPLIVQALQPQPTDSLDLTPYVKLQMCYDSCVPGWQPPSQIDEAILATRAACPGCVIALELSTGYPCWGGGDGCGFVNYQSPAGQALDEIDWEGNTWPTNNWDQYWQVLARLLGPAYVRPANQPANDDPNPPFYLAGGTPRGPWQVQCLEPYTYQWVRQRVAIDQVAVVYQTLVSMGCTVVDSPTHWPVQ